MPPFEHILELGVTFIVGYGVGILSVIWIGMWCRWCFHHHGKIFEKKPEVYDGGSAL